MSRRADVDELLAPSATLGLPIPGYLGRSLPNLASSVARATGGVGGDSSEVAPPLVAGLDPFDGRRAAGPVVLALVDGLGWPGFEGWAGRAEPARADRWGSMAVPITTVFPSTTTAALLSLSTATAPGRHGLVGYRQYLPRYGLVADMLKMTPSGLSTPDLLVGPEWSPGDLGCPPTIFRRGMRAAVLTRDRFHGSGFTRLLYDGAEFVGYATATDLAAELANLLERDPPTTILVYWDELDTIQHLKGPQPHLIDLELDRFLQLLEHVAGRLPSKRARETTLLVTGDHGQVRATPEARIEVDAEPEIARELSRPLSGDRRAGFFSARPGRAEALREALERRLPSGSRVLRAETAVSGGLFGPPPFHPEVAERLGDLIALLPSPACLTYRWPGMTRPKRFLFGAHGGLEPDELVVPLVAGPLESFRPSARAASQQR